jgi:hypothetical protein
MTRSGANLGVEPDRFQGFAQKPAGIIDLVDGHLDAFPVVVTRVRVGAGHGQGHPHLDGFRSHKGRNRRQAEYYHQYDAESVFHSESPYCLGYMKGPGSTPDFFKACRARAEHGR